MRRKSKAIFFQTLMFISSYFPLYIMLIILNFRSFLNQQKMILAITLGILILSSLSTLFFFIKGTGKKCSNIENISKPSDVVISYIMTYIIPLITASDSENETLIVSFLLFILIGYMYIRLNLVYLNPLWAIFGYLVYYNEDEVIISNIPYNTLRKNEKLHGYYILNNIFIAKKTDNNWNSSIQNSNTKTHDKI